MPQGNRNNNNRNNNSNRNNNRPTTSTPVAIGTSTRNSNYGGTTTTYTSPLGQPMTQQQVNAATTPRPSYNNIQSIGEGLRLGGNQYLSAKEAMKISKATGKDYDKVLQKGMDKGLSISGGAIRKSNQAYKYSSQNLYSSLLDNALGKGAGSKFFPDALGMFRNQKPGNKQAYGGSTVQMNGEILPVWSPKTKGTANPLSIKSTTAATGTGTSDATADTKTTVDTPASTPAVEQQLPEMQQQLGPGGLLGGDGGGKSATGIGRKKSRQQKLRIRGAGTNLFNRTNPYQAALNS